MADPDNVARIRAYLEQHRQTYEKQALRTKLLNDGHDPAAVELALAQVYGFDIGPSPAPVVQDASRGFGLTVIGTLLFNYLLLPIMIGGIVRFGSSTGGSLLTAAVLPLLIALLAEIGLAVAVRRSRPGVARGLRWGIVLSLIPVAALVLLFGACVALLTSVSG